MIRFTCPHCGRSLKGDEGKKGKTLPCPSCAKEVVVPAAEAKSSASPEDIYPLAGETMDVSPTLIDCSACGRSIAKTAAKCPQCGSPNNWMHPEVQRFRDAARSIVLSRTWNWGSNQTAVWGNGDSEVEERGGAKGVSVGMTLFLVGVLLLFLGPIGWAIAGLLIPVAIFIMVAGALFTKSSDYVVKIPEFRADFSGQTPRWESNDEEFWEPVRDFFGLAGGVRQPVPGGPSRDVSNRKRERAPTSGAVIAVVSGLFFGIGMGAFVTFKQGPESGLLAAIISGLAFGPILGFILRGVKIVVPCQDRDQLTNAISTALAGMKYQVAKKSRGCIEFQHSEGGMATRWYAISVYFQDSTAAIVGPAWYVKKLKRSLPMLKTSVAAEGGSLRNFIFVSGGVLLVLAVAVAGVYMYSSLTAPPRTMAELAEWRRREIEKAVAPLLRRAKELGDESGDAWSLKAAAEAYISGDVAERAEVARACSREVRSQMMEVASRVIEIDEQYRTWEHQLLPSSPAPSSAALSASVTTTTAEGATARKASDENAKAPNAPGSETAGENAADAPSASANQNLATDAKRSEKPARDQRTKSLASESRDAVTKVVKEYVERVRHGDGRATQALVQFPAMLERHQQVFSIRSIDIVDIHPIVGTRTGPAAGVDFSVTLHVKIVDPSMELIEIDVNHVARRREDGSISLRCLEEEIFQESEKRYRKMFEAPPTASGADKPSASRSPTLPKPDMNDPEKREKEASARLRTANSLIDTNKEAAMRRFREIIERYPGTKAAEEAKKALDENE